MIDTSLMLSHPDAASNYLRRLDGGKVDNPDPFLMDFARTTLRRYLSDLAGEPIWEDDITTLRKMYEARKRDA